MSVNLQKPFQVRFVDVDSRVVLELANVSDQSFTHVEILTVFLRDETNRGGPSAAHIRFDAQGAIPPRTHVTVAHRTWANGRPVPAVEDQMERLKPVIGSLKPYVLDISWEDAEGRTQFQRIPVGH